jgi:hypothetical protein
MDDDWYHDIITCLCSSHDAVTHRVTLIVAWYALTVSQYIDVLFDVVFRTANLQHCKK